MDLVVYNLLNTAARTLGLHRRQVCLLTDVVYKHGAIYRSLAAT